MSRFGVRRLLSAVWRGLRSPEREHGALCPWCCEPLDRDNTRSRLQPGYHNACAVRIVAGSVGHLTGRCPCHGGTFDDPPGMNRREAARAALIVFTARELAATEREVKTRSDLN